MAEQLSLIDTLIECDKYDWRCALYLPVDKARWQSDTTCLVLDPDDVEEGCEEPALAIEANYRYVLSIQDIQGIKKNLLGQTDFINIEKLIFSAFIYYYQNDAYITI